MRSIVLASASPRRKYLFDLMGIPVIVQPSEIEEKADEQLQPGELVCTLAEQKGRNVAVEWSDAIVISADTIVVHENKILGKPGDEKDAAEILARLSAADHHVYSGVCLIDTDRNSHFKKVITFFERTKVTFSALDDIEIKKYIQTGSPMDKAGAYGIQDDLGSLFVKKIDGDYYNVVGFPVNAFYQTLKREHPALFTQIF